jgi:hypothetical protein
MVATFRQVPVGASGGSGSGGGTGNDPGVPAGSGAPGAQPRGINISAAPLPVDPENPNNRRPE